ncbi:cold shock domain-containing protein [bacterium]|jgi:CspA family cold shock protein|nr:cold shock domain-containing protein [bacterium]
MQTGIIARLTDKGFGFISREGETKDLFFHATELSGSEFNDLNEGDTVTFDVTEGPKGLNATNVRLAE